MKILLLVPIIATISLLPAFGLWIPQSQEELLDESQVIFVGNITSVESLEFEQTTNAENYALTLDEYTVDAEESVKNTQIAEIVTVRQPTISMPGRLLPHGGFEIGDRVLFYIESFDGTNTYSKESFLIPKQCDTNSVIHEPRIIGSDYTMMQNGVEKKDNFTANIPIQFIAKRDMDTLSGASMEYDVFISKQVGKIYKERVFHQTITADAKPCEWLSVAEWEFIPDTGNYLLNGRVYKVMSNFSISDKFFSVLPETPLQIQPSISFDPKIYPVPWDISPLKQFNSGIDVNEIKCKPSLVLIQKYDGSPACVTESTKQKLIDRGWVNVDEPVNIMPESESELNSKLTESYSVVIYDTKNNLGRQLQIDPHDVIVDLERESTVLFVNNGSTSVNIFDSLKGTWSFDNVAPSSKRELIINGTGFYEFLVQNSREGETGVIVALSEATNSLPVETRAKMAQSIVASDFQKGIGLIGVGSGGAEPGISIDIDKKFQDKYSLDFYYDRYGEMIPFDVPITIEFGEPFTLATG